MPFEFNEDAWNDFTQQILNAQGDQATLTSVLTDMGDTFTTAINTTRQTQENANKVQEENTRLKEANMNLFLRIGEQQTGRELDKQDPVEKGHNVDNFLTNFFTKKEEK